MSATLDIFRSYRAPLRVARRRIAGGPREDKALATLMAACLLIFVAQWPALAREGIPLDARIGGALLAWIFVVPLVAYVLALLTQGAARLFGGGRDGRAHRMALFWALLAATPAWLLFGLVRGLIGPGAAEAVTGAVAFGVFLLFWAAGLIAAERRGGEVA